MIEKKEKIALVTFVSSIFLIMILLLVMGLSGPIGYVVNNVSDGSSISPSAQKDCIDSDGKDYGIQGNVNYCENGVCVTKTDSCSGKKLTEWLCENDEVRSEGYACEFECDFGACISKVTAFKRVGHSSGGGGLSGGGTSSSDSSSISETQQVYDLETLDSEKSAEVISNEAIKFELSGIQYTIVLESSSQTQATLAINSVSNPITINVGKTQTIDLNSDGNSDISIKVKSINVIKNNKVKLILTP
ncbi:MAG: hypothetical protein Q7S74_05340 [Nanoarchaeota archaeon]|nr:hypothetical protein [Nanoarchaeota archaeon]